MSKKTAILASAVAIVAIIAVRSGFTKKSATSNADEKVIAVSNSDNSNSSATVAGTQPKRSKKMSDEASESQDVSAAFELDSVSEELAGGEISEAIKEILELVKELGIAREVAVNTWKLRKLMERGGSADRSAALRLARELRFSKNERVRRDVLDALSWASSQALPEITEMLSDPDPEIAELAFDAWMTAFNEIQDDAMRCEVIAEAAKSFDNESHMDAVMIELTKVEWDMAMSTIAQILLAQETSAAGMECAKGIYEHMTDEKYTGVEAVLAAAKAGRPTIGDDTGRVEWIRSQMEAQGKELNLGEKSSDGGNAVSGGNAVADENAVAGENAVNEGINTSKGD